MDQWLQSTSDQVRRSETSDSTLPLRPQPIPLTFLTMVIPSWLSMALARGCLQEAYSILSLIVVW